MPFPARIDPERLGAQALAVVEERGWEGWTLRHVAGAVGVTANALYRHVGDREGLVVAIGAAATGELHRALAAAEGPRPILALARCYVVFAVERPDAYEAFVRAKPDPGHPARTAWMDLWALVRSRVAAELPRAADAAAFALWAFLHGRVDLAGGAARLAPPDAGLEDAVAALLDGFRAAGDVPSPLPPSLRLGEPPAD